ncbi:MAG TPA: alpha/beta hydrolase [Aquabacterium sp.]|uniref:alpha/beta hydrolase n=1 Tax=Aquabacterium sp. TaxID=1872578 RepID=UPI002E35E1C6|nr:alpha/beta hydrolase [Aquabacterium sp.]HEX5373009.1 alpha/beta hydrolase [Aquabacterium sp.]
MADPMDALNQMTRALIHNIKRAGFPPLHSLPAEQARRSYRMGVGASEVPRAVLPRVEDFTLPGSDGHAIPARLWAPRTEAGLPVLLYVHGGGFVVGGIDTCEAMCRSVAAQSGAAVVAIDYRLAPEHKYPTSLDDTWQALQWLAREGHTRGLDGSRLAVGGDSAGGTLSAVVALMARDSGLALKLQALFYPSVQLGTATESFKRFASAGLLLDEELMAWFESQASGGAMAEDWHRQPLHAPSHVGVAPAWIGLAECDPLADEGRQYAERLRQAGVPTDLTVWPGTVHDFINMGRFLPEAAEAHAALAAAVKRALFD